ncbi:MAG: hypothetical protein AVDCRST_MAG41-2156, partial [uncultured Corynebacteriales bacterium]
RVAVPAGVRQVGARPGRPGGEAGADRRVRSARPGEGRHRRAGAGADQLGPGEHRRRQHHDRGDAATGGGGELHTDAVPLGEPGDHVQAEPLGDRQVDLARRAEQPVGLGHLGRGHPDAPVLDGDQLGAGGVGQRPAAHHDRDPGRGEVDRVLQQLREQVGQVGDAAADDGQRLVQRVVDPVQVLDLGDRGPDDVDQGDRLPPGPRRVLAGEDQQALGVAADAGRQVVQPEQVGQRVRVPLVVLEPVEQLQLPVEQVLVAPGQVDQQVGGELAPPELGLGQPLGQPQRPALLVLGGLPEEDHADAGGEHRDAVDQRPLPRVVLRGLVVEHQVRHEARPDAVTEHREQDVQQERHPVLVERDEADGDEEVEVRLDGAVREAHQRPGAVGQPEGDEPGGDPAGPHQVPGDQGGQRQGERLGDLRHAHPAQHAEEEEGGQVRGQEDLEQPMATLPRLVAEGVAPG